MIKYNLLKISFVWNFHNEIVRRIKSNIFWHSKKDRVIKTREMFSFLPLINNSVTIGFRFLLLSISAIISLKTINILRFLFELHSSISCTFNPYHSSIQ